MHISVCHTASHVNMLPHMWGRNRVVGGTCANLTYEAHRPRSKERGLSCSATSRPGPQAKRGDSLAVQRHVLYLQGVWICLPCHTCRTDRI